MRKRLTNALVSNVYPTAIGLGVAAWYWHPWISHGFTRLPGDHGDTLFIAAVLEHWFNVYSGRQSWLDFPIWHPLAGSLAYSDGLGLYGVPYSMLRFAGLPQFEAVALTFALMTALGAGACAILLRRIGLTWWIAALGAFATCTSNGQTSASMHLQLSATAFIPIALLALFEGHRRGKIVLLLAGSVILGLLSFTAFYIAFYFFMQAALFLIFWLILDAQRASLWLIAHMRQLAIAAGGVFVGAIPAAIMYAPLLAEGQARSAAQVAKSSMRLSDLWRISAENVFWGHVVGLKPTRGVEFSLAPTPILIIASLAAGAAVFRSSRVPFALTVSALAGFGTVFRVRGHLPWLTIMDLVPGAAALRAIGREGLMCSMALMLALLLALRITLKRSSTARRVSAATIVLVALEQFSFGPTWQVDSAQETNRLAAVAPVPAECKSFYIVDAVGSADRLIGVDGALIAVRFDIPTLNGYSGGYPKNYPVPPREGPTYLDALTTWRTRNGMTSGVCAYSEAKNSWTAVPLR